MATQVRQGKATHTAAVADRNVERKLNPVTPATCAGIRILKHSPGRRVVDPRGLECHIALVDLRLCLCPKGGGRTSNWISAIRKRMQLQRQLDILCNQ
jgi:hypothetical protein